MPMVTQRWRQVGFLHWPFDPDAIAALVPKPLEIDTFDDAAWVGVTPFSTTCFVFGKASVPGPIRFPETNVRTYVRGPDGDGLWFLSLDVTNRANMLLGRSIGLPYHLSDMAVDVDATTRRYRGARRDRDQSGAYDLLLDG